MTCEIVNVGERTGKETIQVYLRQRVRDKKAPYQTLAGFEKVELAPGEKKKIWIRLHGNGKDREIALGSSSRDIRKVIG